MEKKTYVTPAANVVILNTDSLCTEPVKANSWGVNAGGETIPGYNGNPGTIGAKKDNFNIWEEEEDEEPAMNDRF